MAKKRIISISVDQEVIDMIDDIIKNNKAYVSRSHLLSILSRAKFKEIEERDRKKQNDPF